MTRAAAIVALGLAVAGCRTPSEGPAFVPPTALTPVDGAGLVAAVQGRGAELVVLNVWATWCAPCVEEMPSYVRLARRLRARGVELVLVSTDPPETRVAALQQLQLWGAPAPTYLKTGKDMAFIDALHPDWNGTLPATFLYRRGTRVAFWEGPVDYATLEARVLAALEDRP